MNFKEVLCVIIFISMVETLRLNRQRPSTVWGVQKKIFRQKLEKEFFTSKDGTYEFEYDTGNGQHQMFRREKRYVDGTVVGFYGYVDPDGILRITEYIAGRVGFKQRTILSNIASSKEKMESEVFKNLKTLIEALTHSGSNSLDEDIFKQVKKICKSSQDNIPQVYELVLSQLKKNNSQVRLSAFQICRELFKRSVLFRENVLKDLHLIFELTAEINSLKKLPPPKSSAESLKTLAILTLKEWVREFGEVNKKLKVAFNYLKNCKQVDFATLQVHNSAEQVVENEQQRHLRMVNEEKVKKVLEEFISNKSEIEVTVTSLSNCLPLLLPPADEFFVPEHNLQELNVVNNDKNLGHESNKNVTKTNFSNNIEEDGNEDESYVFNYKNSLREFGVPLNYSVTLELNIGEKFKVVKTEENSSVIENAKDCVRLINNRYLPMIKKCIKIYCKCCNGMSEDLKEIIDVKEKLENILKKYNSIVIDQETNKLSDESSSDDDFEEVKKEGYEDSLHFPEELMLECLKGKHDLPSKSCIVQTARASSKADTEPIAGTSKAASDEILTPHSQELDRKKKLLSIAPRIPYDIDLYHWEDENLSTPTLLSTKIDVDKFWGSAGSDDIHEIPNPDGVASLRTRVIEYSGTFEPVKWACRAPLPNGKLCPRKDRFKCPFHGKIVARDEMGKIQNKNDKESSSSSAGQSESVIPEYQDPEFLADLQAATGLDLKIPDKRGKKRSSSKVNLTHKKLKTSAAALRIVESKKLPGLLDVVKKQNNAYSRLSKKIFNRSSLRRVSSVLNRLDRNKFLDKYGDQFNYI